MPADLPPPGTRWGDLTDEQRAALPVWTVLGPPQGAPVWGMLIRHNDGWRDANGNIVDSPATHRPILSYPAPADPTPRLSTANTANTANNINWISLSEKLPPDEKFVLLTGDSGYRTTSHFVVVGRRYESYRPAINGKIRWLDIQNDALTDSGWRPTHWAELPNLPALPPSEE